MCMNTESDERKSFEHIAGIIIIVAGVMCLTGPFLPHVKDSNSIGVTRLPFLAFLSPRIIPFIGIGIAGIFTGIYKKFLLSAILGLIYGLLFLLDIIVFDIFYLYKHFTLCIGFYFMFFGVLALLILGIVGFVNTIRYKKKNIK